MARFLAMDWGRGNFHLLSAEVGKQGVLAGEAVVWQPQEELSLANAESLGKQLREFLKDKGLPAGPVLISIGRERVVLKEISHPLVSANEEPALVRFQATKDLSDAAEDVVLDYAPLPQGTNTAERRALAVIVRRDIHTSLHHLCRAAGLKLLALVPRPFTIAGCLSRAQIPDSPSSSAAVVMVGERWAEFSVLQGSMLLFSRSLGAGSPLVSEVRRGLTVFGNQPGNINRPSPRALFLVGGNGARPSLHEALGLPVDELGVLTADEEAKVNGSSRSSVAACLGLLQAWSKKQMPINLASPKEPVVVADPGKRRRLQAWVAAAVVLLVAWIFGQNLVSRLKAQAQTLKDDKEEIEGKFKREEQDKEDLKALKEWDKGAIPWIDEFYDLAARFPQETGFRISKIEIQPLRNKDRFQARMIIRGTAPPGKENLVHKFIASMRDPHLTARVEKLEAQSFAIHVDLSRQAARDYQTRLLIPYTGGR